MTTTATTEEYDSDSTMGLSLAPNAKDGNSNGDEVSTKKITKTQDETLDKSQTEEPESKYKNWPRENVKEPLENDVMCGRGAGTNYHPGNQRYREMVEKRKPQYVMSSRLHKPLIALDIVREWRAQLPPGRFLKYNNRTQEWDDVGDKKAREKTSQALREKTPQNITGNKTPAIDPKSKEIKKQTDKLERANFKRDHTFGNGDLEIDEVDVEGPASFEWQDPSENEERKVNVFGGHIFEYARPVRSLSQREKHFEKIGYKGSATGPSILQRGYSTESVRSALKILFDDSKSEDSTVLHTQLGTERETSTGSIVSFLENVFSNNDESFQYNGLPESIPVTNTSTLFGSDSPYDHPPPLPAAEHVKRETSNKIELPACKVKKRAFNNRDRSATSNRLKEFFIPELFRALDEIFMPNEIGVPVRRSRTKEEGEEEPTTSLKEEWNVDEDDDGDDDDDDDIAPSDVE